MIAGGSITAGFMSNHASEIVYQGLSAAVTTQLMGVLLIGFGWNTRIREETAIQELDETNKQLAKQLIETKNLEHEAIRQANAS